MIFTASLHRTEHKNRDSVENKSASLLVASLDKDVTGCLHIHVAHRWRFCASPSFNCEAVHPTGRKKRLLGTHQFTVGLVGGGATNQS